MYTKTFEIFGVSCLKYFLLLKGTANYFICKFRYFAGGKIKFNSIHGEIK